MSEKITFEDTLVCTYGTPIGQIHTQRRQAEIYRTCCGNWHRFPHLVPWLYRTTDLMFSVPGLHDTTPWRFSSGKEMEQIR